MRRGFKGGFKRGGRGSFRARRNKAFIRLICLILAFSFLFSVSIYVFQILKNFI